MTNSLLLKMAIERVSFPIKNCDFPFSICYVSLPEGILADVLYIIIFDSYLESSPQSLFLVPFAYFAYCCYFDSQPTYSI